MKPLLFMTLMLTGGVLCAQPGLPNLNAVAHYRFDGNAYEPIDSSHYFYSGQHTGQITGSVESDSAISWKYQNVLSDYALTSIQLNSFDLNDNTISYVYQTRNGNNWVNNTLLNHTYNSAKERLQTMGYLWNGTKWDTTEKVMYAYANFKEVENWLQQWNKTSHAWISNTLDSSYYDASKNLIAVMRQQWNALATTWVKTIKITYEYDANQNLDTAIYYNWNVTAGMWIPETRSTYTYNADKENTEMLLETWLAGTSTWMITQKYTYAYDADHNQVSENKLTWNSGTNLFVNQSRKEYTNNSYSQRTSEINLSWNANNNIWQADINSNKYIYHYDRWPVHVPSVNAMNAVINMYPIPANNTLYANILLDKNEDITISVTGMDGRLYSKEEIKNMATYHAVMNLDKMPNGQYVLTVTSSTGSKSRQFTVHR